MILVWIYGPNGEICIVPFECEREEREAFRRSPGAYRHHPRLRVTARPLPPTTPTVKPSLHAISTAHTALAYRALSYDGRGHPLWIYERARLEGLARCMSQR